MGRRVRVPQPTPTGNQSLDEWLRRVADTLNEFPNFILGDTSDGPEGTIDADACTVFYDTNSSATTCVWVKTSDNTSVGWRAIDLV